MEDVAVQEVGVGLMLQEEETHLCGSQTSLKSAGCEVVKMADHFSLAVVVHLTVWSIHLAGVGEQTALEVEVYLVDKFRLSHKVPPV